MAMSMEIGIMAPDEAVVTLYYMDIRIKIISDVARKAAKFSLLYWKPPHSFSQILYCSIETCS